MDSITPLLGAPVEGPSPADPREAHVRRLEVSFEDADAAYLVAAFVRYNLDAAVATGVVLVPTLRGPGLEIAGEAVDDRVVRALIRRFGGRPT